MNLRNGLNGGQAAGRTLVVLCLAACFPRVGESGGASDPACTFLDTCLDVGTDSADFAEPDRDDGLLTPGEGLEHPTLGTLRYIPSGIFTMGCLSGRDDVAGGCFSDESPAHDVMLTQGSWMMESEFTQAMWATLGYTNRSRFVGPNLPVEMVSWWDAIEAANAQSAVDGLGQCYVLSGCGGDVGAGRSCESVFFVAGCQGWKLPTESQWEWAARGGQELPYAGSLSLDAVAWSDMNSGGTTHSVCAKQRNGYALCDMSGNVWEWVIDGYGGYSDGLETDPRGPSVATGRVNRGGSWYSVAANSRVAHRNWYEPDKRSSNVGFRLLRTIP